MGDRSIEDYVSNRIESASADNRPEDDVYAFSLWVSYVDDDPRRPEVWFGSNTESQVEASLGRASDPLEARWNFAFWRQNQIAVIGGEDDADGAAAFASWFQQDLGLWFTDDEDLADLDSIADTGELIAGSVLSMLADVVARLHERGSARGPAGRVIPIIVHELEYGGIVADLNQRANPGPVLPESFLRFCRGE